MGAQMTEQMSRDDVMRETVQHVRTVGKYLLTAVQNLQNRIVNHDASKFSPEEFDAFAAETPGLRTLTYGSEEYKAALARLGPALAHHYKHNNHHPEHYGERGIHSMDLMTLIEMLADWKAASERHANGSLTRSIVQNAKRFGYDDRFAVMLARTAANLGWIDEVEFQGMEIVP